MAMPTAGAQIYTDWQTMRVLPIYPHSFFGGQAAPVRPGALDYRRPIMKKGRLRPSRPTFLQPLLLLHGRPQGVARPQCCPGELATGSRYGPGRLRALRRALTEIRR